MSEIEQLMPCVGGRLVSRTHLADGATYLVAGLLDWDTGAWILAPMGREGGVLAEGGVGRWRGWIGEAGLPDWVGGVCGMWGEWNEDVGVGEESFEGAQGLI